MENERNTTFSPLFNELKIYRKEIVECKLMESKGESTATKVIIQIMHSIFYAFIQKLYVKMLIPKVLQK